uniref:Uncharacterized protein n=1 Tax=Anguilla anguilla TaxID=7936 RepID=A0A0E9W761_ANGAN
MVCFLCVEAHNNHLIVYITPGVSYSCTMLTVYQVACCVLFFCLDEAPPL